MPVLVPLFIRRAYGRQTPTAVAPRRRFGGESRLPEGGSVFQGFAERFQLGDGLEVFRPSCCAFGLDQLLEAQAEDRSLEEGQLDGVRQQILIAATTGDLPEDEDREAAAPVNGRTQDQVGEGAVWARAQETRKGTLVPPTRAAWK